MSDANRRSKLTRHAGRSQRRNNRVTSGMQAYTITGVSATLVSSARQNVGKTASRSPSSAENISSSGK